MNEAILKSAVDLLADAIVIVKIEEVRSQSNKTRNFNIFEILGRTRDEVKGHSKFLEVLLNPKGVHGLGDVFLKVFFDEVNSACSLDLVTDPEAVVVSEKYAPAGGVAGRIDLYIETETHILVIENKIDASDQEKQLERYMDYVKSSNPKNKRVNSIYLTLDGQAPSDDSRGRLELGSIHCISYDRFVRDFLDKCIKECANYHSVRESINQYRDLVGKLTNENYSMTDVCEISNKIDTPEKLKAASLISQAVDQKRIEVGMLFWEELKSTLKDMLISEEVRFDIPCSQEFDEKKIKRGTGTYGIWIKIYEKDGLDYCFSVAQENGDILLSIRFLKEGNPEIVNKKGWETQFHEVNSKLGTYFYGGGQEESWPIWCRPRSVEFSSMKNLDNIIHLFDSVNRKVYIAKLSEEIRELISSSISELKNLDGSNTDK
jgi:hypothetical protein